MLNLFLKLPHRITHCNRIYKSLHTQTLKKKPHYSLELCHCVTALQPACRRQQVYVQSYTKIISAIFIHFHIQAWVSWQKYFWMKNYFDLRIEIFCFGAVSGFCGQLHTTFLKSLAQDRRFLIVSWWAGFLRAFRFLWYLFYLSKPYNIYFLSRDVFQQRSLILKKRGHDMP